jgi:hypothetical protein
MKSFLLVIVGFLVGVLAHGLWGTRGLSEATPAVAAPPAAQGIGNACAFDWERMKTELRLVLHDDAMQAARRTAAEAAAVSKVSDAPATAEQKEASVAQSRLLEQAIKAGVWRDEDAMKLRTLMPKMAPADRFGALTAVSRAINQGQVKLEAHVPF